jgi:uncharacterized protein (DUF433 family)
VVDILQWLSSGMTEEEILDDYSGLTEKHIKAAFYFDIGDFQNIE